MHNETRGAIVETVCVPIFCLSILLGAVAGLAHHAAAGASSLLPIFGTQIFAIVSVALMLKLWLRCVDRLHADKDDTINAAVFAASIAAPVTSIVILIFLFKHSLQDLSFVEMIAKTINRSNLFFGATFILIWPLVKIMTAGDQAERVSHQDQKDAFPTLAPATAVNDFIS